MSFYEILEHPADLKIRVWGKSLKELFVNTALAMAEQQFLFDKNAVPKRKETIAIESETKETLLVEFLSEILYLSDVNNLAYCDIKIDQISDTKIKCRIGGVPIQGGKVEIKAVTYHDLEIKKTPQGWEVVILYDI